jgi:hypothetical protein
VPPVATQAPEPTRLGTSPSIGTGPRAGPGPLSPLPGFLLDSMLGGARGFLLARGARGPFTRIDFSGAPRTQVGGINDHGTIVGRYENPAATPDPQPTGMRPLRRMRQGDLAAVVSDTPEDL